MIPAKGPAQAPRSLTVVSRTLDTAGFGTRDIDIFHRVNKVWYTLPDGIHNDLVSLPAGSAHICSATDTA